MFPISPVEQAAYFQPPALLIALEDAPAVLCLPSAPPDLTDIIPTLGTQQVETWELAA